LKAVILAAGRGERLSTYTNYLPKPMIKLLGKPLLEHVILSCKEAGIHEFVVVTGYLGNAIKSWLSNGEKLDVVVDYAENYDWQDGNGTSLYAAQKALSNDDFFILSMSDHIYSPEVIRRLVDSFDGSNTLCTDKAPMYLNDVTESTKVKLKDNFVTEIGKSLRTWDAIDAGVFLLRKDLFTRHWPHKQVVDKMRDLVKDSLLKSCDITGLPWIEVDTMEDLQAARNTLGVWR
jgi:choline kinase